MRNRKLRLVLEFASLLIQVIQLAIVPRTWHLTTSTAATHSMPATWLNRFELKAGRWVYVPTPEARASGAEIKRQIEKEWSPPDYYLHLQKGGHIAALRSHIGNNIFLKADVQNFFGSINRTRVTRCLKTKFSYETAREFATASTVTDRGIHGARYPMASCSRSRYASLCLSASALGRLLRQVHGKHGVGSQRVRGRHHYLFSRWSTTQPDSCQCSCRRPSLAVRVESA